MNLSFDGTISNSFNSLPPPTASKRSTENASGSPTSRQNKRQRTYTVPSEGLRVGNHLSIGSGPLTNESILDVSMNDSSIYSVDQRRRRFISSQDVDYDLSRQVDTASNNSHNNMADDSSTLNELSERLRDVSQSNHSRFLLDFSQLSAGSSVIGEASTRRQLPPRAYSNSSAVSNTVSFSSMGGSNSSSLWPSFARVHRRRGSPERL